MSIGKKSKEKVKVTKIGKYTIHTCSEEELIAKVNELIDIYGYYNDISYDYEPMTGKITNLFVTKQTEKMISHQDR